MKQVDEQLYWMIKDIWRKKVVKIVVLTLSFIFGLYFSFIPMLQVIFGIYGSTEHKVLLVILVGMGTFILAWSIREIYRMIKRK